MRKMIVTKEVLVKGTPGEYWIHRIKAKVPDRGNHNKWNRERGRRKENRPETEERTTVCQSRTASEVAAVSIQFQSTPPAWGATWLRRTVERERAFQSTPPAWGATAHGVTSSMR